MISSLTGMRQWQEQKQPGNTHVQDVVSSITRRPNRVQSVIQKLNNKRIASSIGLELSPLKRRVPGSTPGRCMKDILWCEQNGIAPGCYPDEA